MRALALALFVTLSLPGAAPPGHAQDGGFDAAALAAFARAQGGSAAPRVYAYGGTVYDVPGGRILATVDGYQIARAFPGGPSEPDTWYVVRRAFLLYVAPDGSDVLAHYPDVRARSMPVAPLGIARYQLRGDRVHTTAVSGVRGSTRNLSLPEQLGVAREDDDWVFRRVLSPPDPQQQPLELTEILLDERAGAGAGATTPRIRAVMTKVADNWGFLPAGGRHLLHLTWRPVASPAALPARVKIVLEEAAPGMQALPPSLAAAFVEIGIDGVGAPAAAATR